MKTKMKALALALCAVMLVATTVFVTVAYLTSTTEQVTNTFSVGNVVITLDEADVDNDSTASDNVTYNDGSVRDIANAYKLLPGLTYAKDPTVHVKSGSEPSYIRMIVTITDYSDVKACFGDNFLPQNFVNGWNADVWKSTNVIDVDETADTATYEFRYYKIVSTLDAQAKAATVSNNGATVTLGEALDNLTTSSVGNDVYFNLEPLFTQIKVPGEVTNDKLANLADVQINVKAYAIQAAGFPNEDAAWAAFPTTTTTDSGN